MQPILRNSPIKVDPRDYVMPVRKDWNAMGPPLPAWFKRGLRNIDPFLRLQYMPPDWAAKGGVNADVFPCGAWVVCRAMRRTGWLHKRWTLALFDPPTGGIRPPTRQDLRDLKRAKKLWRRGQGGKLHDEFDKACRSLTRARNEASRAKAMDRMAGCMRKHNFTQYGGRRIQVPGASKDEAVS
jgi:hypothetical protein